MRTKTSRASRNIACYSLLLAMIVLTALWAEENPRATEGEQTLITQCVVEITELGADGVIQDGAGIAMSFSSLQELGPKAKAAIPVLSQALRYDDSYARIQSAYTLWRIDGRADAIPLLGEALKDQKIKVRDRAMAAEMLGRIGPEAKAAIPVLTGAIKDPSAEVRVKAAYPRSAFADHTEALGESKNIAADMPEVVGQMSKELDAWIAQVNQSKAGASYRK